MYRPATLFQPSFLSKMVNSSELPFPSGQLQVAIDASLSEMANIRIRLYGLEHVQRIAAARLEAVAGKGPRQGPQGGGDGLPR